jgi:hypothetical protein
LKSNCNVIYDIQKEIGEDFILEICHKNRQLSILSIWLTNKICLDCQWLAKCRWFSLGSPVSSTNTTDRHDIAEILLKVKQINFFNLHLHDIPLASANISHIMLYTSPWWRFVLTTSVVIGTDYIGSCKSNYHTITATTVSERTSKIIRKLQCNDKWELASANISYVIYLYHRYVHVIQLRLGVWFSGIPRCIQCKYVQ